MDSLTLINDIHYYLHKMSSFWQMLGIIPAFLLPSLDFTLLLLLIAITIFLKDSPKLQVRQHKPDGRVQGSRGGFWKSVFSVLETFDLEHFRGIFCDYSASVNQSVQGKFMLVSHGIYKYNKQLFSRLKRK